MSNVHHIPGDKEEFAKMLLVLATLANISLRPEIIDLYFSELRDLELKSVIGEMRKFARSVSPKTGLPTIDAIRERLQPKLSDEDLATELSFKIIESITKFGYCNGDQAQKYLGPLGWEAVRRLGGWSHFCEQSDETPLSILEKKARDVTELVVAQSRGATYDHPQVSGNNPAQFLISSLAETLTFDRKNDPEDKP